MTLSGMIEEKVAVPNGVKIEIDGAMVTVTGPKGKHSRVFSHPKAKVSMAEGHVVIRCELPKVKDKAIVGTFAAHIANMIEGVTDGFEYRMKNRLLPFPDESLYKRGQVHHRELPRRECSSCS